MTSTLKLEVPVEVDGLEKLDQLNRDLDQTGKSLDDTSQRGTSGFKLLAAGAAGFGIGLATAGIGAALDGIGNSIELASDKAEAASKVNILFGESADVVTAASEGAAQSVGLSSGAYLTAAGNVGNLVTNMGIAGPAAADMSVDIVQLAADMGSFNNLPTDQAVEAIGAAFRGETEPIRAFGVMLSDATIKAKALELGLYDGTGALDDSAKATATYQLILEKTSNAQGDFARTSEGLANSQKIANARVEEAWTRVGDVLAPIAAQIVPMLADGMEALVGFIEDVVVAVSTWADDNRELLDTLSGIGDVIFGALQTAFGWLMDIIGELGYRFGGLIGLFIDLAGAIVDLGAAIAAVMRGDFDAAGNHAQLALERIQGFQENVQRAIGDAARRTADETEIAAQATARSHQEALEQTALASGRWWTSIGQTAEVEGARIASGYVEKTAENLRRLTPRVDGAAQDLAQTLPDRLDEGAKAAGRIAAETPGALASRLRSTRDDWRGALDQLRDDMKNSLSKGKEIAELEAVLSGKALARGLKSTDPIVRAQALETVDLINGRLATLQGLAFDVGSAAGRAVVNGLHSSDHAVRGWAAQAARAMQANLQLNSPAKEGPFSRNGGPEAWMGHNADLMLRSFSRRWDVGLDRWSPGSFESPVPSGSGAGGGGRHYAITVQTLAGDPVAMGREIVTAIQAYERGGGRDWRASPAG